MFELPEVDPLKKREIHAVLARKKKSAQIVKEARLRR
jgi:hypothetical protein